MEISAGTCAHASTQARVHVWYRGSTCKRQYFRYVYLYTYTDTYTLMRQSRNLALHAWWQVQEPRRWWWNTNTSTCTRTRTQTGTRTRVHFKYRESTYIRQVTGTYWDDKQNVPGVPGAPEVIGTWLVHEEHVSMWVHYTGLVDTKLTGAKIETEVYL